VKRVGPGFINKDKAVGRISSYLLFTASAMFQFRLFHWADKVIVVSNPPTLVGLCAFVRVFFRKQAYFMVQDLYPDLAIHLGYASPRGIMSSVMYGLNRLGFSKAEKIVLIGEAMRRHFAGDPHYRKWSDKAVVIPNWEDPEQVFPAAKDNPWSRLVRYNDRFVVLYAGNIGLIQDLDSVLEAAKILNDNGESRGNKDIVFLFAGEGGRKIYIQKKAADMGLDNVRFIGYVPTESYNDLLATADCGIVALKPGMDSFGFPVRTYSYMAAGRPVIAITEKDNELYRMIENNVVGISAYNGKSMAEAILRLKNDPALAKRLGDNGRAVLLKRFARKVSTGKYNDLIDGKI
jgi:glycosyltransferase involved in cell wall biosynthesis